MLSQLSQNPPIAFESQSIRSICVVVGYETSMSRRRRNSGGYHGGSTLVSKSGWGFTNSPPSLRKKQLEHMKRMKAEAEAIYAELEARRSGQPIPRSPNGRSRPADTVGKAKKVARIATGEVVEKVDGSEANDSADQVFSRKGGKARAEGPSAKRRKEISGKAAAKRSAEQD